MIKHLIALTTENWIAIAVPVIIAVIGGICAWYRWIKDRTTSKSKKMTIHQEGSGHTAANVDGDKNIIAGGNVQTGIDSDAALNTLVKKSEELGQAKEKIKQLEEQLAHPQRTIVSGEPQIPQPTQEAKDLAAQIEDDAGPYAQALKAIATGNPKQADEFLDQTQQFLDQVQERKDQAQAKIYLARMQNTSYDGRPQDALIYAAKLKPLAGNDSLILNEIATVYYENANYKDAEPLMRRALEIDEKSFGPDHPKVATDLNNLAQLLQATNRLKEAEPLMERHLLIFLQFTRQTGHPHPHLQAAINNYTALLTRMGQTKEQINARLQQLDPDFFAPTDNQSK